MPRNARNNSRRPRRPARAPLRARAVRSRAPARRPPAPRARPYRAPTVNAFDNHEVHMSPGAEQYTAGMLSPAMAPPCGMPVGGTPSEKNKCFARGRLATGTANCGFILVAPGRLLVNDSTATGTMGIAITGATYAGTQLTNVLGTGVTAVAANSPYPEAFYGNAALKGRLVAAEVRVRYSGTELNRGGDAVVYCDPNHNSLSGLTDAQLLSNAAAGRSFIAMEEWISCKYNGVVDAGEETFLGTITSATVKNANHCMAIMINSAVAGATFDFEVYAHFEVIGTAATTTLTKTVSDPIGHGAVNAAVQQAQIEHAGSHEEPEFVERALTAIIHTVAGGTSRVGAPLAHESKMEVVKAGVKKYLPSILRGAVKYAPMALALL